MSTEEFERHKEALKSQKLEKPKRLSSQYSHYMNEIALQQYHFDRSEKEVDILMTITKDQVLEYYKVSQVTKNIDSFLDILITYFQLFIAPDASSRQPLSIHILSNPENIEKAEVAEEEEAKPAPQVTKITDLTGFKSSKTLYPMAKSFINIIPKGARSKL
jgi:hypothetical protein